MKERNKSSNRYLIATVASIRVLISLFGFLWVGGSIIGNTLSVKEMIALGGLREGHLLPSIFISVVSHISSYHPIPNLLFPVVLEEALNGQYEWLVLLIVSIISGFLGGLVPSLLHSNIVSMGPSGSIFGWITLLTIACIRFDSKEYLLSSIFVLLIVGISLVSTLESGGTNVSSHVVGFIYRIILGFILKNVSSVKQGN